MKRPDVAAWAVTGLALLLIGACALLHVPIPDVLVNLSTAALGAAAGVSFAGGSGIGDALSSLLGRLEGTAPASSSSTAPASSAAPAAPLVGATSDPAATGVFRVATHS